MSDPAEFAPSRPRMWLAAALAGLAFVAWRVLTSGAADLLSKESPAAALRWRGDEPEALLLRAESRQKAGDQASAARLARAGVQAAPLDGRAYRVLALQADAEGDATRSETLHRIAAARGPRDLESLAWLAQRALQAGEFDVALAQFDRMLRIEPELFEKLNQVMIPLAMQRKAQAPLVKLLAARPTWRLGFTLPMVREAKDPEALFHMMETLRTAPGGLYPDELAQWLDRLAQEREWARAYLVWVRSLSAEASRDIGNIYNGRFELEPSGTGFDWRLSPIPGVRMYRARISGAKGEALAVAFEDRRVPFEHARQLLALPPGRYRLVGRARLEDLRTERGLVWTVSCPQTGLQVGETSPFRGSHDWKPFEALVTVPEQGCDGQWLVLRLPARIPAEQRIGGTAWFDDLKLSSVRD